MDKEKDIPKETKVDVHGNITEFNGDGRSLRKQPTDKQKLDHAVSEATKHISKPEDGKSYPAEMRILAKSLYSSGDTFATVAQKLGIGETTARNWVNEVKSLTSDDMFLMDDIRSTMSAQLWMKARKSISSMTDEDFQKASLKDKALTSSILIDKGRLLDGESTENLSMIYSKKKSMDAQTKDLDAKIKREEDALRRDGLID